MSAMWPGPNCWNHTSCDFTGNLVYGKESHLCATCNWLWSDAVQTPLPHPRGEEVQMLPPGWALGLQGSGGG